MLPVHPPTIFKCRIKQHVRHHILFRHVLFGRRLLNLIAAVRTASRVRRLRVVRHESHPPALPAHHHRHKIRPVTCPEIPLPLTARTTLRISPSSNSSAAMRQWLPRHPLHQFIRRITLPRPMNFLAQPIFQRSKFPLRKLDVQSPQIPIRLLEKLRRIQIPQRIRWEISNQARAPVNILQHPVRIIRRRNT